MEDPWPTLLCLRQPRADSAPLLMFWRLYLCAATVVSVRCRGAAAIPADLLILQNWFLFLDTVVCCAHVNLGRRLWVFFFILWIVFFIYSASSWEIHPATPALNTACSQRWLCPLADCSRSTSTQGPAFPRKERQENFWGIFSEGDATCISGSPFSAAMSERCAKTENSNALSRLFFLPLNKDIKVSTFGDKLQELRGPLDLFTRSFFKSHRSQCPAAAQEAQNSHSCCAIVCLMST